MNRCGVCGARVPGIVVERPDGSEVFSPDNHRARCGSPCLGGGVKVVAGSHRRDACAACAAITRAKRRAAA